MTPEERRARVMKRSMRLGHCVCNPRQPCPCPLFREKRVCTCAGEQVPSEAAARVKLTDHVRAAGCAGKVAPADLARVLARLPAVTDPRLVVGVSTGDDAGVFRLSPEITIVQTVDVFTPVVDDPFQFGRVAACNSLSDVYAMGGEPVTALSIVGFPMDRLPHEAMAEMIRGGMSVLAEAGVVLLGGHSIENEEVLFGFAVTGTVTDRTLVTNAGARPGDRLVLTKPLGTGIVTLARRIGRAPEESVRAALESMTTLNREAARIMVRHGAHACTDVTGFGLLGHLSRMAAESGVDVEIVCADLPRLPGVDDLVAAGVYSGANERNAVYCEPATDFDSDVGETDRPLLFDAQTSGGLLIALPGDRCAAALEELRAAGLPCAGEIGAVRGAGRGRIRVRRGARRSARAPRRQAPKETTIVKDDADHAADCCGERGDGGADDPMDPFAEFVGSALKPGAVDVVTKELAAVALSLAVHCESCAKMHVRKALKMGIGHKELAEMAALAAAFGGCRSLVLWNAIKPGESRK